MGGYGNPYKVEDIMKCDGQWWVLRQCTNGTLRGLRQWVRIDNGISMTVDPENGDAYSEKNRPGKPDGGQS
jgi:hypothetical protein